MRRFLICSSRSLSISALVIGGGGAFFATTGPAGGSYISPGPGGLRFGGGGRSGIPSLIGSMGAGSFDEAAPPAFAGTGGGAASTRGGGTALAGARLTTCGGGAFQTGNLHPSLVCLESYGLPCLCFIQSSTNLAVSGTARRKTSLPCTWSMSGKDCCCLLLCVRSSSKHRGGPSR